MKCNDYAKNTDENETKLYIGLTEHTFKKRFNNHLDIKIHENEAKLSKYIWQIHLENKRQRIRI